MTDVSAGFRPPCWCLSRWAPTWRLHTNLYKFRKNVSPHIFRKKNCCDLNLGESLCISTFFLFPDSRLSRLNGFYFLFWSILNGVTLKTSNRSSWGCHKGLQSHFPEKKELGLFGHKLCIYADHIHKLNSYCVICQYLVTFSERNSEFFRLINVVHFRNAIARNMEEHSSKSCDFACEWRWVEPKSVTVCLSSSFFFSALGLLAPPWKKSQYFLILVFNLFAAKCNPSTWEGAVNIDFSQSNLWIR